MFQMHLERVLIKVQIVLASFSAFLYLTISVWSYKVGANVSLPQLLSGKKKRKHITYAPLIHMWQLKHIKFEWT